MLNVQRYKIFVASPTDVVKERQDLNGVIQDLNNNFCPKIGVNLLLESGKNAVPDMGRPQGVINRQLDVRNSDIFIGIMWWRFGTPTGVTGSGTKEEFDEAFSGWETKRRPRIMFYFNQMPAPIKTREQVKQYDRVLEFQEQFNDQRTEGLYSVYNGADDFKDLIRGHLMNAIWDLVNPTPEGMTDSARKEALGGVDPVDPVERWRLMSYEERARAACEAAESRNEADLFNLMTAWLRTRPPSGRAGMDVTVSTLRNYRTGIRQLLAAWPREDLLHPTPRAAATWVKEMEQRGRKSLTIQVRIGAARALYGALRWSGAVASIDPFADITIRDDRPLEGESTPYSSAEFDALRAAAAADAADLALLLLTGVAGLGAQECVGLRREDIKLTRGLLFVRHGKGRKTRSVPIDASLAQALQAIPKSGRDDYVLPFRKPISVWRRFKLLCERAGVTFKTGNALRHTAGIRWYRQTKSLELTAQYLGLTPGSALRYIKWSEQYP